MREEAGEFVVSLNVTVHNRQEWTEAWNALSQVADGIGGETLLSSREVPPVSKIEDIRHYPETDLYYDENTVLKVYLALREMGIDENKVSEIITEIQNNGILFRERLLRPAL